MASFDRKTGKVTLNGSEMLKLARFILNHTGDDEIGGWENEVEFKHRTGPGKPLAWFAITGKNVANFKPVRIEFAIDYIYPDDN